MHPFVLPFLLAATGQEAPIELRFRPAIGEPMAYGRTIVARFSRPGSPTVVLYGAERSIEIAKELRPDGLLVRVVRRRDPWRTEDDAAIPGVASSNSLDVQSLVRDGVEDEEVSVATDGSRPGSGATIALTIGPDWSAFGDGFVRPSGLIRPGDPVRIEAYPDRPDIQVRFEATTLLSGEKIALFSVRPSERSSPTPLVFPSLLNELLTVEPYGAFAVRVRDGIVLRSTLSVVMRSKVAVSIAYESALDGAPTWAEMNLARWAERSRSDVRTGSGR